MLSLIIALIRLSGFHMHHDFHILLLPLSHSLTYFFLTLTKVVMFCAYRHMQYTLFPITTAGEDKPGTCNSS